jgi:hypothetical protein
MKYECKENDCLIEIGRDKSEILVSVQGETAKTVIGLKDLNEALILFGVVGQSEQLKPKEQICYKSNNPCKYDCSGLCKESC